MRFALLLFICFLALKPISGQVAMNVVIVWTPKSDTIATIKLISNLYDYVVSNNGGELLIYLPGDSITQVVTKVIPRFNPNGIEYENSIIVNMVERQRDYYNSLVKKSRQDFCNNIIDVLRKTPKLAFPNIDLIFQTVNEYNSSPKRSSLTSFAFISGSNCKSRKLDYTFSPTISLNTDFIFLLGLNDPSCPLKTKYEYLYLENALDALYDIKLH